MALTLYADTLRISPYVFSTFVALREKGIPFDVRDVSLHEGAQKRPEYARSSVTARVPAIDHDGFWLAESSAIVEYLDDAFPAPAHPRLLPADIRERARARQLLSWLRSDDTLALRKERPTTSMFYEPAKAKLSDDAAACADKLLEVAGRLVAEDKPNLFDTWSLADADLTFMLQRLLLSGGDAVSKIRAYGLRQWKRPSLAEFAAIKRPPFVPYG